MGLKFRMERRIIGDLEVAMNSVLVVYVLNNSDKFVKMMLSWNNALLNFGYVKD